MDFFFIVLVLEVHPKIYTFVEACKTWKNHGSKLYVFSKHIYPYQVLLLHPYIRLHTVAGIKQYQRGSCVMWGGKRLMQSVISPVSWSVQAYFQIIILVIIIIMCMSSQIHRCMNIQLFSHLQAKSLTKSKVLNPY